MNKFLVFANLIFLLAACSSTENKETSPPLPPTPQSVAQSFENFEKGKILSEIKCKADTSNSYSLYVPNSYTGTVPFPVLLFFDSHGGGAYPLKKYFPLAEKYGYILAGSNNSKNGNAADVNAAFAGNLISDVRKRLNIDPRRIYASGFSGGSRVAAYMAIYRGNINTVIGCGAGWPNIDKPVANQFNYIGIVGTNDFNYTEMEDLEKMLLNSTAEHIFISFNGKHEWPPEETMAQAFTWLQFRAMKDFFIQRNDSVINNYVDFELKKIDTLLKTKKHNDAFAEVKQAINTTAGLITNKQMIDIYTQLEKSEIIQETLRRKEELSKTEKTLKEQYLNALAIKDAAWWKTETQNLTNSKKFPTDQLAMNKRILSYMSLACYMGATQMLHTNQISEAEHFISIYKIVDPENAEAPYLQATIYLAQNKIEKAFAELKNAAKLGFKENDRFLKDFSTLEAKQKEIISTAIKENSNKE